MVSTASLLRSLLVAGATFCSRSVRADDGAPPDYGSRVHNVTLSMGCPEFLSAFYEANVSSATPYRTFTVTKGTGYGYVALHLPKLWLPAGSSIVLRGVESVTTPDIVFNLTNLFPSGEAYDNVTAPPLLAKELRVELYRDVGPASAAGTPDVASDRHCYGFVVDSYDYVQLVAGQNVTSSNEATCANDNTKEAICYYDDAATRKAYLAARTVARLLIQKEDGQTSACTGWLLGAEGHLITNYHCINTTAQAAAATVEFMADAASCAQSCMAWGACAGTVEAISTTLVHASEALDYALVKLQTNVNLPAKYGFLRLKTTAGRVGQEIYIPQHPLFYGKRIAMVNDFGTKTSIISTAADGCGTQGSYAYDGDTQAGSSGSPVIDQQDHGVVALHHCGQFCANTGIPSVQLIADMQANGVLPAGATDPGDNQNTANFPAYTPPAVVAAPTLTPKLTFNGVIQRNAATGGVSVDQFEFSLANDAVVSFDVLSAEVSDDGTFKDLNGDCKASYLDAIIFLFRKDDSTVVLVNDDAATGRGQADGSISSRDPFAQSSLKAGTYVLALAAMPVSSSAAYSGVSTAPDTPEIYTCVAHSQAGSYSVAFHSSRPMTFTRLPQAAPPTGTCSLAACDICTF